MNRPSGAASALFAMAIQAVFAAPPASFGTTADPAIPAGVSEAETHPRQESNEPASNGFSFSHVPEPSAVVVGSIGILMLLRRRQR